jgi:hypothetical protein
LIAKPMEKEGYKTALDILKSLPTPTLKLFQKRIDKIETNLLLGSA